PERQEDCFTVAADGTDVRYITPPMDIFVKQDWSPDGRHIAVTTNAEDRSVAATVVTVRPDGSGLFEVTHYVGADQRAVFGSYSPDGQWILFRLRLGDQRALFRVTAEGTDSTSERP